MTSPIETDPFYRELRRRHPDVDIVLLPDPGTESVDAVDSAPLIPAEPEQVARDTADSFSTLWPVLTGLRAPCVPGSRWRSGTSDELVFAEVVGRGEGVTESATLLVDAAQSLASRSWQITAPRGGVPRLLAGHHGRSLSLSVWDDVVTMTLRSEPYRAALSQRRTLLRERRP